MTLIQILPWAVFAAFACGAWALINFLGNRNSRADERLDELRNPLLRGKGKSEDPRAQSGVSNMMEKAAPTMASAPSTDITLAMRPPGRQVSAMLASAASTSASPKAACAAAQPGPRVITQPRPDAAPEK